MSHRQASWALLGFGCLSLFVAICTGHGAVYLASSIVRKAQALRREVMSAGEVSALFGIIGSLAFLYAMVA